VIERIQMKIKHIVKKKDRGRKTGDGW